MHIPMKPSPMMGRRWLQEEGLYAQPVGSVFGVLLVLAHAAPGTQEAHHARVVCGLLRTGKTRQGGTMLDRITQIAPLYMWGLVLGSTLLLLCGFVAFGHAKVVNQAYGKSFGGGTAPGQLETTMRWTVILLTGGVLLFGVAVGWPPSVLTALGGVVVATLILEGVARLRA
jgi:hypothetical protein